jgi:hypothetical protein
MLIGLGIYIQSIETEAIGTRTWVTCQLSDVYTLDHAAGKTIYEDTCT